MVILGTINYAHEVNDCIYLKLSLINSVNKTITENNAFHFSKRFLHNLLGWGYSSFRQSSKQTNEI